MWAVGGSEGVVRSEKGRRKALAPGKVKTRVQPPRTGGKTGRNAGPKKPLTRAARVGLVTAFPFTTPSVHDRPMAIEIKIRKNEPIDRALRRMKKKLDRENIIKGTRAKRYYEKPCEKRRRKDKVQAFTQMLRRRYAE